MTRRINAEQARVLTADPRLIALPGTLAPPDADGRMYSVSMRLHTPPCGAPVLDCTCDPHIAHFPSVTQQGYEAARAMHNSRAARIRRGLS